MDDVISAAEAKVNLDALIEKVQREPITISKNDQPVAVLMSMEEYETLQRLELERLRSEVQTGLADLAVGRVVSGREIFAILDRNLGG